jgi:peptidyl-prolyl cis-trans isomerase B (cyclophilin B)
VRKSLIATLAVGGFLLAGPAATASAAPLSTTPPPPKSTHGPCGYTTTPDDPAARPVGLPWDPKHTPDRGSVDVKLKTNQGDIPLKLDRAEAPCTVQSFLHLTLSRFYDHTTCHRLTTYTTLKVLQCGDPTGTGDGGPGYSFKDELPTNLPPSPTDPTGARKVYARGVLAMANAGPDTNGSQFFLVFGDSALRPNYTIFGTVGNEGLKTLDKVAAGGVKPDPTAPPGTVPVDGAPVRTTNIAHARLSW